MSGGTQWSVELPQDVESVRVTVHGRTESDLLGWGVVGRYGAPVVHDDARVAGRSMASPDRYRFRLEGEATGSVEIAGDDLKPGETLFLQMLGRALSGVESGQLVRTRLDVSVEVQSADVAEEEPEGCGCQGSGPAPLWLWLAAAALRRRGFSGTG